MIPRRMIRMLSLTLTLLSLLACLTPGSCQDPDWWKHSVIYQIYPRSFQDSDGDGIGDLRGIESRLDYLQYLGVDTVWLSPIYTSPMADFGYDVADYRAVDPVFGTMKDFDNLLKALHDKGMYLVMDFIPNHSSDLHPWFVESCKGGADSPYSDYYRWSPGKVLENGTTAPPNNWLSIFGGSAWEWHEGRKEYYLHQFVKEQPDLNYRNPRVVEEMQDALRLWLQKGVDGFRIDAIGTMFEFEDTSLDEPPSNKPGALPHEHEYLLHPYTMDQPEIHDIVRGWRKLLDGVTGHHTLMVMEVYDPTMVEAMKYYHSGADMPFNFNLIFMNMTCGGVCTRALVDSWLQAMPAGKWPNNVIGNHDNKRITTRKSEQHASAMNMLLLTLPGTPTTYYGEELALRDIEVSYEDTQDPFGINMGPDRYQRYSRDPARAPMQWSDARNAGFSEADRTWLPVNPDYVTRNVDAQKKCSKSPLEIYRKLTSLRRAAAFRNSELEYIVVSEDILSYARTDGHDVYLVALNLGMTPSTDDYVTDLTGRKGRVLVATGGVASEVSEGAHIDVSNVTLQPGDGIAVMMDGHQDRTEL